MATVADLSAQPVPLRTDADGVLRVGSTRVTLDSVVAAFHQGCSPEKIILKYPSLHLTDVYAVITYYLWHRSEMDAYLDERQRCAKQVREEIEQLFPPAGVRERLLSRCSSE